MNFIIKGMLTMVVLHTDSTNLQALR